MKNQPLLRPQLLIFFIFLYHSVWTQPLQTCADTSFRIRYGSSDNIQLGEHITTSDLGIIAVGGTSQATGNKLHGLIVKVDAYGNQLWTKKINVTGNPSMLLREIRELRNGDYLVGAELIDDTTKIYLARLNASGVVQWQKVYMPDNHFDYQDATNLYTLEEGAANDLYFSFRGSHTDLTVSDADSSYNLIAKLDGNGNLLWSKGFAVSGSSLTFPSTNPIGLYSDNRRLLVFGQLIDTSSLCPTQNYTLSGTTFFGMALNETTGELQAMKSYCYHEMPTSQWTSAYVKRQFGSSRLLNNQFALFGRFYSTTNSGSYLFNVVFDASLNLF